MSLGKKILSFMPMACLLCLPAMLEYLNGGYAFLHEAVMARFPAAGSASPFLAQNLYSIVTCVAIMPMASLTRKDNSKDILVFALAWNGFWCLLAGNAKTLGTLCLARSMQGLAAAAVIPAQMIAIQTQSEDQNTTNIATALTAALPTAGYIAGASIAALVPKYLEWKWFFHTATLMSMIVLVPIALSKANVEHSRIRSHRERYSFVSILLLIAGLSTLVCGLDVLPYQSSPSPWTIVCLSFGATMLLALVVHEVRSAAKPLIPKELVAKTSPRSLLLASGFFYAEFSILTFWFPIFARSKSSRELFHTVLAWTPTVITSIGLSLLVERTARGKERRFILWMAVSTIGWIISPSLLIVTPASGRLFWILSVPALLACSLGIDTTYAVSLLVFTSHADESDRGIVAAVSWLVFELGSIVGLVTSNTLGHKVDGAWQIRAPFALAGAFALGGSGTFAMCIAINKLRRKFELDQVDDESFSRLAIERSPTSVPKMDTAIVRASNY